MTTPQERVDRLVAVVSSELGRAPTQIVVAADDWDWFAREAIKREHQPEPEIRFGGGWLLYNGIRIKRHR